MVRPRLRPLVALLLVQIFFASLVVAAKYVLNQGVPPFALAATRVFLATLFLAFIAWRVGGASPRPRDLAHLALLGLLGVVLNQLLFIKGLQLTTAVNTAILVSTIPVFTLAIAVLLRREHFDPLRLSGVAVAMVGTAILLRIEAFDPAVTHHLGNLLIVLNCISYSFYLVLSRRVLQRFPPAKVVAWTFAFGALIVIPVGAPDLALRSPLDWTPLVWLVVAWIVAGPTIGSYGLNNYALKHVHASTVGTYVFLQILLGVLLSVWLLPGEHLSPRDALGGLLILAGVFLVSRREALAHRSQTQTPISGPPHPAESGRAQPQPEEVHPGRRGEEAPGRVGVGTGTDGRRD